MSILSDIRLAVRFLARRPAEPALIAGLFALSIGLASGMWAVVDAVALRPLPYRDGGALVAVLESHPARGLMAVAPANFLDWASRVKTVQDATGLGRLEASITGNGEPIRVIGTRVTERFFDLMGVTPARGRGLNATDFRADGRAAVIGHGIWERQFGRDPAVIGTPLLIDGQAHTVVGVMPREFKTIGKSEFWIPWIMSPAEQIERRFHLMGVMARLRAGRTALDAQQELGMVYRQLQAEHPGTTSDWTARVMPLRELMLGDSRRVLLILGAATLVLIVVASINVAGLLLAWLPSRRQEFLVRMAIGASVSRVVRQLFVETLTCAIAGMAGGGLLAVSFVRLFGAVGLSPTLEYDFEPSLDTRVILTMCVLVLVNVAVTGLVPCVMSVKRSRDLVPRRAWATGVLGHRVAIAMQVALSVVLLGATADLLAGFQKLASIAKQGAAAGLAVDVSLSERRYPEENNQRQFFERLLSALATRQEIQAVAAANYLPPARIYGNIRFEIEGRSTPSDELTTLASAVSPGVFKSLGISLLRGRWIDDRDRPEAPRAGVISSALMRRYWPNEDPLGRRIALVFDPVPITIVGVVDDVRQPLSTDARAESMLYLSYRQVPSSFMSILFVPAGGAAPAVAAVREEVKRIDPAQAAGPARAIDEIRAEWLEQPRLRTRIVTLFGVSTLLLTLVGLYARVAYAASSRAREFAIRQALGARPSDVIRILTTEALAVVSAGLVTGLALLPAASSAVRSIVGGMPRIGIGLAGAIAALFSMAAFGSAYWPARRIGQLNPAGLLRSE